MYNLGMDGQTDADKTSEDVAQEALPVVERVSAPEEPVVLPENNTEAVAPKETLIVPVEVVAETALIVEEQPVCQCCNSHNSYTDKH